MRILRVPSVGLTAPYGGGAAPCRVLWVREGVELPALLEQARLLPAGLRWRLDGLRICLASIYRWAGLINEVS